MGAEEFFTVEFGRTPEEAFDKAVADAQYYYGHGGYTGTIAEKNSFVLLGRLPARWPHLKFETVMSRYLNWKMFGSWSERVLGESFTYKNRTRDPRPGTLKGILDERFKEVHDDKWGPAVCIELNKQETAELKAKSDRKGTRDRWFLFCGMASS